MTPKELEKYLHHSIPLSEAMQVSAVEVAEDSVLLAAPLAPNTNHHGTVFGGSASAVAILSAWCLVHVRLREAGHESRLVIRKNSMEYQLPIAGAFTARSSLADAAQWQPFLRMLSIKGKARISACSVLEYGGLAAGRFVGEFVALNDGTD